MFFADTLKIVSDIIGSITNGMDQYLESHRQMGMPEIDVARFMWGNSKGREFLLEDRTKMIVSALDSIRLSLRRNPKVICFSEVNDSMLMWSHYANYHKVFLLAYDSDQLSMAGCFNADDMEVDTKTKLLPVNYVLKQTDMSEEIKNYIRYNMFETMDDVKKLMHRFLQIN